MNQFQKIGIASSLVFVSNFAVADFFELVDFSSDESGSFFANIEIDGDFSDTFNFTVPENRTVNLNANVKSLFGYDEYGYEYGHISFSEVVLKNSVGELVPWFIDNSYDPIESWAEELVSGDYSLILRGSSSDPLRYQVWGSWSLENVSPTPEPSSIALMLGGLGLVGFMAARRRKQR